MFYECESVNSELKPSTWTAVVWIQTNNIFFYNKKEEK